METSLDISSNEASNSASSLDFARNDNDSILLDGRDRHRGNAFAAADRARASFVVALMLTCDSAHPSGGGDFLPHRGNVRRDLRRFRDDSRIDVDDRGLSFRQAI